MDPSPTIAQQLAALPRLTVKELQLRYADLFGDVTVARNKAWLVKRIAWKVQAARGGLTDRARVRAAELAIGTELRTTGPAKRSAPAPVAAPIDPDVKTLPFPADRRLPPPGSVLTRAYKGQTHDWFFPNLRGQLLTRAYKGQTPAGPVNTLAVHAHPRVQGADPPGPRAHPRVQVRRPHVPLAVRRRQGGDGQPLQRAGLPHYEPMTA